VRGEGERVAEKDPVVTKTEITGSMLFLSLKSFGLTIEISPFKGLMEKSCIMDSNPELYLKMRDNNSMCNVEENLPEDDDMLSIEDEIERERRVFQNRRSGVSILNTHNMLDDL
jgi:DNA-directed RNA polymerase subunit E'/Rpb7